MNDESRRRRVVRTWGWFFRHDLRSSVRRPRAIPPDITQQHFHSLWVNSVLPSEFDKRFFSFFLFALLPCCGCECASEQSKRSLCIAAASSETYGPDSILDSRVLPRRCRFYVFFFLLFVFLIIVTLNEKSMGYWIYTFSFF